MQLEFLPRRYSQTIQESYCRISENGRCAKNNEGVSKVLLDTPISQISIFYYTFFLSRDNTL